MSTPILTSKLYVPRPRPDDIPRLRLIERLNKGLNHKLILLSAPAGFGKTTLLAEWLKTAPTKGKTGWVFLDHSDNDPAIFWTYFITAARKIRFEAGKKALASLNSPQPPAIESVLTTWINEVYTLENSPSERFVLVLDDYHVIDSQRIHETLAFLLEHIPSQMCLVIAGRSDPPLPIARLRARRQLTELRITDLRFTANETAAFLKKDVELELKDKEIMALESRTEGWIAGLQLAVLSMKGREDIPGFIAAFTGNDRYIGDYLVEEVLQRQPESVREFLLKTSVLDRLNASLCDAVTGRKDGNVMLESLERNNLFVVPLDDNRQWYRYHHLFADVLRTSPMAEQHGIQALHQRASAWFEEQNMTGDAIRHANAAGDHESVARLLTAYFEKLQSSGRYASISRWAASLPDEMVRQRPRLALIYATSALATEDNNQTARTLTSWAQMAIASIEADEDFDDSDDIGGTVVGPEGLKALKGEVLALKLFHSSRSLPPEEVAEIACQALEMLPPDKHRVRALLHVIRAKSNMKLMDLKSSLPIMEMSAHEARRAKNPALLSNILKLRGQVNVVMGKLLEGRQSYEDALRAGQKVSGEAGWIVCGPHTGLAEVMLEHGDLAAAKYHARKSIESSVNSPPRSHILFAHATAAQVFQAAGDIKAAFQQLAEAKEFVRGASDSRFLPYLSSVQLKIYCKTGDLKAAGEIVHDRELKPGVTVDGDNEEEMIAYCRYLIACEECRKVEQIIPGILQIVRESGRVQHEIHALVLQGMAYELQGKRAPAIESLGRATRLGESGRFNHTFSGEGKVMSEIIAALLDEARRKRNPEKVGSISYLNYLLREQRHKPEATPSLAGPIQPVTAREVEILGLIAAGMRNQEIADHLFISLHTVKRHIANVYGKLGVSHRTEAVARANELRLF